MWPFWRTRRIVNPIGFDPVAGRVHDLEILPGGQVLLHTSTCWCRSKSAANAGVQVAPDLIGRDPFLSR